MTKISKFESKNNIIPSLEAKIRGILTASKHATQLKDPNMSVKMMTVQNGTMATAGNLIVQNQTLHAKSNTMPDRSDSKAIITLVPPAILTDALNSTSTTGLLSEMESVQPVKLSWARLDVWAVQQTSNSKKVNIEKEFLSTDMRHIIHNGDLV